jgi:Asp-tRNA(Asn)/Glu-tRNA(Gln) amidotransferase A subunit family amidase
VLGIPVGPYLQRAGAEALDAFHGQVQRLRSAGFAVREVPALADFDAVARQLFVLNRYEAARSHAAWFPRYGHLYREETAATVRQGQAFDHSDHVRASRERELLRDRLLDAMAARRPIDLWLAPSATGPAPLGLHTTGDGIMCLPWSYAGLPALSLPAGRAANGLPLGLQLIARPGADELLLAWAASLGSLSSGSSESSSLSPM